VLTWSPLIFAIVMTAACVSALVVGAWEERLLGGLYLAACVASLAAESRPWAGPQWAITAIDAIMLLASIAVVLASTKAWPIVAAALQVLTMGAHVSFALAKGGLGTNGYLTVLAVWSYGAVGCIAYGVVQRIITSGAARRRRGPVGLARDP
jgi:hypothetical protein